MTKLERYRSTHQRITQVIESAARQIEDTNASLASAMRRDLSAFEAELNPPPEMERVTVERWTFGDGYDTFATEGEARCNATHVGEVYKLTGSYQREKKQPVEKSVELWFDKEGGYQIHGVLDFSFQGRRGVFTWTE